MTWPCLRASVRYIKPLTRKVTTVTTNQLPRYIQKANQVIATIAECPDKTWTSTQRELGLKLDISQPELSNIIKLLLDNKKIEKGEPIPGVRGKNHTLILSDETPFEKAVARNKTRADYEMSKEHMDLFVRSMQETMVVHENIREKQNNRLREYREIINNERKLRLELLEQKDALTLEVKQLQEQLDYMTFKSS